MNAKLFYLWLVLPVIPCFGQRIITCSQGEAFWYIPGETAIAVPLQGDIAQGNRPELINIDDKAVQYAAVPKSKYTKTADIEILADFVGDESAEVFLKNSQGIAMQLTETKLKTGKVALTWSFKAAESKNKNLESQVFIYTIIDDMIFGLGSPQFRGQKPDDIEKFLIDLISNTKVVESRDKLCKK